MNNVKLTGIINTIFPTEQVTPNFEKRVFWLDETGAPYTSTWSVEMWHDNVNNLDGFKVGDHIACTVDIIGRKWSKGDKSAVFTTLKCIEMFKEGTIHIPQNNTPHATQYTPQQKTEPKSNKGSSDVLDDAPF